MKYLGTLIIGFFVFSSCQIEDDNAPSPDDSFIKYFGELTSYEAKDIEFLYDSSGFIVFGDVIAPDGSKDFAIMRMSLSGVLLDSTYFSLDIPLGRDVNGDNQNDTIRGEDAASQIEVLQNGYAFIGTSLVNDNNAGILNVSVGIVDLLDNELNSLLDTVLVLRASSDARDGLDYLGKDIIQLNDGEGSLLIGGSIEVDRGGVTDFDFNLIKINQSGVVFNEIIGIPGDDQDEILARIFEKENGNIVMIGYSSDNSALGENGGNNGTNVTFTELNSDGKIINSISYGLDDSRNVVFNEVVNSALKTESGFAITGTSTLSTDSTFTFFMNLTNSGVLVSARKVSSSFTTPSGSELETLGNGIVQGRDNDYIILGQYDNFNIINELNQLESRAGEAMFMKIDQFGIPVIGSESNFGTADGDDSAVDALTLSDGKLVVLSNTDFGGGIQLITLIKTNDTGDQED